VRPMSEHPPIVVNVADAPEIERKIGEHWGAVFKILTPGMRPRGGSLGVNLMRVPKGRTTTPFHTHACEDEVFYILSGRGVLRYGDELIELRVGDCVSCAAGTGIAHQIANPHDEELVYLAIGTHAPHEVCTYPDSGKILVRTLQKVGRLEPLPYMDGEPTRPKVFDLIERG
jgi:uncharacterized cupin superfamily protein